MRLFYRVQRGKLQVVLGVSESERTRIGRGFAWTKQESTVRRELYNGLTKQKREYLGMSSNEDKEGRLHQDSVQFHFYVGQLPQAMEIVDSVKSLDGIISIVNVIPRGIDRFNEFNIPYER